MRTFPASMFDGSAQVSVLAWAPDSRHLLILSAGLSQRLVVLDTTTGKFVSVVTLPESPWPPVGGPPAVLFDAAWSPRGDRIAYSAPSGISVVSAAGNSAARHLADAGPAQLAWSPDGAQLAIAEGGRLRVIAPDSHGRESQSFAVTATPPPAGAGMSARNVAWSPDGERIALAASAGIETFDLHDGTTQRVAALQVGGLLWSPDGMRIAYAGICDGDPNSVHRGICIVGHGGGPVLTLVEGTGRDYRPLQWHSDGVIVFASLSTGI
jgi:WD40 repeat protein